MCWEKFHYLFLSILQDSTTSPLSPWISLCLSFSPNLCYIYISPFSTPHASAICLVILHVKLCSRSPSSSSSSSHNGHSPLVFPLKLAGILFNSSLTFSILFVSFTVHFYIYSFCLCSSSLTTRPFFISLHFIFISFLTSSAIFVLTCFFHRDFETVNTHFGRSKFRTVILLSILCRRRCHRNSWSSEPWIHLRRFRIQGAALFLYLRWKTLDKFTYLHAHMHVTNGNRASTLCAARWTRTLQWLVITSDFGYLYFL